MTDNPTPYGLDPAAALLEQVSAKPRNRTRPLTSEWLKMRGMLERANLEREAILRRAWKWQAAVGFTALIIGAVIGKAL